MGISHVVRLLGIRRRSYSYWITNIPPYYADGEGPFEECGPYQTIEEAQDDQQGLQLIYDKMAKREDFYDKPSKKKDTKKSTIVRVNYDSCPDFSSKKKGKKPLPPLPHEPPKPINLDDAFSRETEESPDFW